MHEAWPDGCVCDPADSWTNDETYECDMGWQAFQASCYKLNLETTDWETAQKTCQKMEANLVSIHTLPELEFITRTMKKGDLALVFPLISATFSDHTRRSNTFSLE